MKAFLFFALLFLKVISCKKDATGINGSVNQIRFSTDKHSYSELDTINLCLKNSSSFDIVVGLRSGGYLEMFHQIKENDHWSEKLWF